MGPAPPKRRREIVGGTYYRRYPQVNKFGRGVMRLNPPGGAGWHRRVDRLPELVDELLHRRDGPLECRALVAGQLDLEDPLHAARAQHDRNPDE
jgi:hypothetical protein